MQKNSLLGTYSWATYNNIAFSIQCWSHKRQQNIFQIYAAVYTSRPCLFRIVFRWHILAVLSSVGVFLQYAVMHNYLGSSNVLCMTAYWINILFCVGLVHTNSACPVSSKYRFSEYNGQDATFLNLFISVRRSTCFRRFFPSIIRSSKLHIQHQVFVRPLLLPAASRLASSR